MSNSVEAPGSSPNESDVPAAPASGSAPPPQTATPSPSSKNVSPLPPTTKESSPPSPQSSSPPAKSLPPSQSNAPPPKQPSPSPPKSKSPPPNQSSPPPPQSDAPPPEKSSTLPPKSDSPPPSPPTVSPPPAKSNSSPPPSLPKPSNNPPTNSQTTPESPPAPMLSPPPESSPATPAEKSSPLSPENSSPISDTTSPPPSAGGSVSPASGGLQQSQPPLTESISPSSPSDPNKPNAPPNQATSSSGQIGRPTSRGSPSGDSSSTSPDGKGRTDSGIELGDANDDSGHAAGKIVAVAAVVSVLIIMVIGVFLLARRRKNRRHISTNNFSPKTDGVRYGQVPHSNVGTPIQFLGSQPSPIGDSNGSPRTGNTHPGGTPDSAFIGSSKIFFSYEELMELTSAFSHQNIVGEGGFGCVYKGCMQNGKMVAVKQLKLGSGQGDREFKAEVEIISRVHHRHLVSLVGYCISDNQRLLIYDFVPNKTLEHHLHTNGLPVLDWTKRLKIAIGSAKGLAYLHEDCYPKIIHRDIKSANILLDDDFEAQVADFGLARLNDTARSHVSTRVMGTFGYLAPEYATSGKLTDKSDVFSFGVVLLELISGRKPIDPTQPLGDESLVEWARPLLIEAIESGDLGELVDPRLGKNYVENEMFRMVETAAACVRHSASKRPRMVQVVRVLDSENELSDISNGVKFGKSIEYDFDQYSEDIRNFRRLALGSSAGTTSSEFDLSSGEYASRDTSLELPEIPVSGSVCGESETRAMNPSNRENYGSDRLV